MPHCGKCPVQASDLGPAHAVWLGDSIAWDRLCFALNGIACVISYHHATPAGAFNGLTVVCVRGGGGEGWPLHVSGIGNILIMWQAPWQPQAAMHRIHMEALSTVWELCTACSQQGHACCTSNTRKRAATLHSTTLNPVTRPLACTAAPTADDRMPMHCDDHRQPQDCLTAHQSMIEPC